MMMEETMRRIVLATALAFAVIAAGALAPGRAEAMTLAAPAGLQAAIGETSLAQDAAYVCARVWRCGPYGCGWRRVCSWTGPRRYWGHRGWRWRHYRRW